MMWFKKDPGKRFIAAVEQQQADLLLEKMRLEYELVVLLAKIEKNSFTLGQLNEKCLPALRKIDALAMAGAGSSNKV